MRAASDAREILVTESEHSISLDILLGRTAVQSAGSIEEPAPKE